MRLGVTPAQLVAENLEESEITNNVSVVNPSNSNSSPGEEYPEIKARTDVSAVFGGIARRFEIVATFLDLELAVLRFVDNMDDVVPLPVSVYT